MSHNISPPYKAAPYIATGVPPSMSEQSYAAMTGSYVNSTSFSTASTLGQSMPPAYFPPQQVPTGHFCYEQPTLSSSWGAPLNYALPYGVILLLKQDAARLPEQRQYYSLTLLYLILKSISLTFCLAEKPEQEQILIDQLQKMHKRLNLPLLGPLESMGQWNSFAETALGCIDTKNSTTVLQKMTEQAAMYVGHNTINISNLQLTPVLVDDASPPETYTVLGSVEDEIARGRLCQQLNMQGCKISVVGENFLRCLENLIILDVSDNQLTTLPSGLLLEQLFAQNNRFEEFPPVDGRLIKTLNLAGNQIRAISCNIADWLELEDLNLSGNQLQGIKKLPVNLKRLDLSDNPGLVCLPELESLPKLTYLNLARIPALPLDHNKQSLKSIKMLIQSRGGTVVGF